MYRFLQKLLHSKEAFNVIPTWEDGQPTYTNTNFWNNVNSGYKKNELIYSCITKKADTAALPRMVVTDIKSGEPKPDHQLQAVLNQPNPHMTGYNFAFLTILFLDLAGRAYWEIVRSRAGRIVQLWPLRPDWMYPIKSGTEFISGYEYRVPTHKLITLDTRDVLDFKLYDPINLYSGLAPVSVAARIGDTDNSTTDFIKLFFEKGGMPPGIISSKLRLQDKDIKVMRKRWRKRYGGWKKWIDPAILDKDATYQKIGLTFKEMGFETLDARSEARICMVLKVPPILVGAKVGLDRSTFSNYAEARKSFWQDTMIPQYKLIVDECNSALSSEYPNVVIKWDYSDVPALRDDEKEIWERSNKALVSAGITRNEFRDFVGLGPVANGDVFLQSLTFEEVPAKTAGRKDALPGTEQKALSTPDNAPDDNLRRATEKQYRDVTKKYFGESEERVWAVIKEEETRVSVLNSNELWAKEQKELGKVLTPMELETVKRAVDSSVDAFVSIAELTEGQVTAAQKAAGKWAKEKAGELIKDISKTTRDLTRDNIVRWMDSGQPLSELRKNISYIYGKTRAEGIAVTEVTTAFHQGNIETWDASELVKGFIFMTAGDDVVCPICTPLNGKEFKLREDVNAPSVHVRCRCFTKPVLKEVE